VLEQYNVFSSVLMGDLVLFFIDYFILFLEMSIFRKIPLYRFICVSLILFSAS
jgi:hypothetical protein